MERRAGPGIGFMNNGDSPISKKIRGRPPISTKSQVMQRLLEATERLLREQNHLDLTERKIAAAAGTNEAMIHYYFGSKDGLLFELIARQSDEVLEKLKALDTINPVPQSVTRHIFKTFIDAYYAKPWIGKIMVSELARSGSTIKGLFLKRYGAHGMGLVHLRHLLSRLIDSGVYDSRINAEYAALSMFYILSAPLMLASLSGDIDVVLDNFKKDSWIDHVTDLFDRQLRTTERKDAIPSLPSMPSIKA